MSYYPPIVATLLTMVTTALLYKSRFGRGLQDIPNSRSLHDAPVPRIGGVGMLAGMLAGWGLVPDSVQWWIVLPLIGLFVISLIDDMRSLSVKTRLMAHLAAAAVLLTGSGIFGQCGVMVALLVLLITVWMTNLYNFMDGSDGLAGGMALFGFGAYGIAAQLAGNELQAVLNLTISAAALGFLFFNLHPARVFMGDAGSIPLGFLAAGMGVWGWRQELWEVWFPILVFSPFIADASVTLLKRTLKGKRITEAHRDHYYQRLIRMGWGHRNVAYAEYALMLGAGATALSVPQQQFPWPALLVWGGIYGVLMRATDSAWKKSMAAAA